MKNNIIILNGCSSSGKTSLLNAISDISENLFLRFGIDLIWGQLLPPNYIMFNKKSHLGFKLQHTKNGIETIDGKIGKDLSKHIIKFMKTLYSKNYNIIYDDVILNKSNINKFKCLRDTNCYLVGVFNNNCFDIEKNRGDRPIGLVQNQISKVHQFQEFYDFSINNSSCSIEANAKNILNFIANNESKGLKRFFLQKE